jgi:DNA invertase Pin-like site-specific DNA recombinase
VIKAVAYMRTSSAANVGPDKDSEKRQRAAIEGYANRAGLALVDWFYDAAISGSDHIETRPGFKAMLERIAGNGVRCIIVESPDRFARDLAVQLAGHDYLKALGITLIPATAPDFFTEETPTAVLVRQVLGAISQFEKATIVAKLKVARDRKRAETGKCGGQRSMAETRPELVELAHDRGTALGTATLAQRDQRRANSSGIPDCKDRQAVSGRSGRQNVARLGCPLRALRRHDVQ